MYLSKETILNAYDVLSKATPSILNNFSAIQYFVATDRFFKKNGKPCDSSSSKSKAEFYGYVEEVILLDDNNYLSSFKTIYEGSKSVSSTVSSNFFSGSSVEHSNNTSGKRFDYPKKSPLLYALDGKVYKEDTYYENLSDYLKSNEEKFALAIWLLRQCNDFDNTTIEEVRRNLETKYSSLLVNTLIPSNLTDMDYLANTFTIAISEDRPQINKNDISKKDKKNIKFSECINDLKYLAAICTKPFLLLAGISGTGKSRIVRKLAQMTVTEELQKKYDKDYSGTDFENERWNLHTPANFKLIQVKPNWHNSMDVVGYLTNIPEPHYVFTPFVEFIARAWQHQDIPFFLCLDEMNLAPVEEYFAEFLSAIESRSFEKHNGEKVYVTDPIIKPFDSFGPTCCGEMMRYIREDLKIDLPLSFENELRHKGLTLPKNLIVIGTVNMDETTYSFSRKVLDRAMSFEMNDVDYVKFLKGTTDDELKAIREELKDNLNKLLTDRHIEAKEIIPKLGEDAEFVVSYLDKVNKLLAGTPFKLGYRAANEAMLYVMAARETCLGDAITAMNDFTLMKILSRFEGDSTKMRIDPKDKRLKELEYNPDEVKDRRPESTDRDTITILSCIHKIIEDMLMPASTSTETEDNETSLITEKGETKAESAKQEKKQLTSLIKLESMMDQLNRERFVSYWN